MSKDMEFIDGLTDLVVPSNKEITTLDSYVNSPAIISFEMIEERYNQNVPSQTIECYNSYLNEFEKALKTKDPISNYFIDYFYAPTIVGWCAGLFSAGLLVKFLFPDFEPHTLIDYGLAVGLLVNFHYSGKIARSIYQKHSSVKMGADLEKIKTKKLEELQKINQKYIPLLLGAEK